MSEAPPASRPAPLRVPVIDVATRSSLVAKTPQPMPKVLEVQAVVVQRAVRISDAPPPSSSHPPRPSATIGSSISPLPPSHTRVAKSPLPPAPGTANGDGYAAVEVEAIDPLELAESFDMDGDDTHVDDAQVLEVALPPPAPPPEALRRSAPSQGNDVEITVTESDDEEDDRDIALGDDRDITLNDDSDADVDEDEGEDEEDEGRVSGEFEELDVDEARAQAHERSFAPPPPPPPPRVHLAEPPDLSTLTRSARVQEVRPSKSRAQQWWEVFFDDDYLRTVRPPSREQIARQVDFLERRLKLAPGGTLLDAGCGLGMQVVELCSRGYLGVGLDLSLAMLSRASEEAQARGMRINFLHGDMREMNFEGTFDALICLGTTFGYFDDDTNRRVLDRFLRALKPGGTLLLDMVNRDHVIRSQPNLVWFEGDGCVCMEESEFNFFTSRLHVKRTVILEGGKQAETEYSLRLYSLHEVGLLLHGAGFRVTEVSGREALPGVFFGGESPQMIVVAERQGPGGDHPGKHSLSTPE